MRLGATVEPDTTEAEDFFHIPEISSAVTYQSPTDFPYARSRTLFAVMIHQRAMASGNKLATAESLAEVIDRAGVLWMTAVADGVVVPKEN